MPDFLPLFVAALGCFLIGSALALLVFFPRPQRAEAIRCWRVALPRDAKFSATQAAAWFAALAPLLRDGQGAAVELRGGPEGLRLLILAPAAWAPSLQAQLTAWLPGARLEPVPPGTELPGSFAAVGLRLDRPEIYPLRVAGAREPDPLLGLAGALSAGGSVGLQIAWNSGPHGWRGWAAVALAAARAGRPIPPRGWRFWPLLVWQTLRGESFTPSRSGASVPTTDLRGASSKARNEVFSARLTAWAGGPPVPASLRARALAEQVGAAFRDPLGNALVPVGPPQAVAAYSELAGLAGPELCLSAAELGSLFHLPEHLDLPREGSRLVPPPPEVMAAALHPGPGWLQLGEGITPDGALPFGLTPGERRRHLYVVGKTGTGKSTLLAQIVRQDLEAGRGLALIDPHGDLAERVLTLVPPERYPETVYLNPADREFPVPLNPLHAATPAERPLVASGVVGVLKKLSGESWGPRLEHILRNSCLALLETPHPSLALLPRLLTDREYRRELLSHVRDPVVRGFFLQEYESYDPRWRAEAAAPVLTRVGAFLASPLVRNVVGAPGPGLDLRNLLDQGGILIANLSTGKIGEDSAALLGGLLVARLQLAAMARAELPEEERRDFCLLVDEFQHFAGDAFLTILSEARKYHLSLVLSHQYLDQVPERVSDAVFGNVGSLAVFRVGQGDTARLVRELAPQFDAEDLVHLPDYRFCARLAQEGGALPAFTARTVPLTSPAANAEQVREASRRRWGRARAEVELELADVWEGRTSS